MPFYILVIFISFVASLTGLMLIKENRIPPLILFSFFLLLTVVAEYYGSWMSDKNLNNLLFYNLFTLFEFIFYLLFFWQVFSGGRLKRIILLVTVLYAVFGIINIYYIQGTNNFHSHTYVLGCTLLVVFSILYFYTLFRFPESGSLAKNPFFWIAAGIMFYYTCTFSVFGLENYIISNMRYYSKILIFITDLLNILLYTLFTIGFLCRLHLRKLLPS